MCGWPPGAVLAAVAGRCFVRFHARVFSLTISAQTQEERTRVIRTAKTKEDALAVAATCVDLVLEKPRENAKFNINLLATALREIIKCEKERTP